MDINKSENRKRDIERTIRIFKQKRGKTLSFDDVLDLNRAQALTIKKAIAEFKSVRLDLIGKLIVSQRKLNRYNEVHGTNLTFDVNNENDATDSP